MARMRIALLVLATLLVLGACTKQEPEFSAEDQMRPEDMPEEPADGEDGGDGEAPAGDAAGTWVAVDIDYSDAPTEVATGSTVELVNDGGIFHNVVIDQTGEEILAAEGGETDSTTLGLDPGDYDYHCDVPGHEQAGMVGSFTVTE